MKLYFQPENCWFGDCMPFGIDDTFYLFYLRDTRKPCPFGEPFGWALVTTEDFVTFKDYGTTIQKGTPDEQDQFLFSGSICQGKDGTYHAFYTGYNRDYPALGKASQVTMHAVSLDLKNWTKLPITDEFLPQPGYDPDDWRDPFVFWVEEEQKYFMMMGSRLKGDKRRSTGRTVYYTSENLENWTFEGDFWAPDLFTMHEMPDLFKMGDWWYLITTEYSRTSSQVYRMAKSLKGPWITPDDDMFDGRAYYAARTYELNGKRMLLGWVPSRANETDSDHLIYDEKSDLEPFIWAGTLVAHELYQRPDGTLGCKIPDTVWEKAFEMPKKVEDVTLERQSGRNGRIVAVEPSDCYRLEMDVTVEEGTREFAVGLHAQDDSEEAYLFSFLCKQNRMMFEKLPNWPWPQMNNMGLERPVKLDAGKTYHIQIIVDDTIATLYVDGVALNARMYANPGNGIYVSVTDGKAEFKNIEIAPIRSAK